MNITIVDWLHIMWHELCWLWITGIICWGIVFIDWVHRFLFAPGYTVKANESVFFTEPYRQSKPKMVESPKTMDVFKPAKSPGVLRVLPLSPMDNTERTHAGSRTIQVAFA